MWSSMGEGGLPNDHFTPQASCCKSGHLGEGVKN